MGNTELSIVNKVKHMGIEICKDNSSRQMDTNKRIGKGQSVLNAARGMGSECLPLPPHVLSKIYWAVAIPRMLYGLEITYINEDCFRELEKSHRKNSKIVQNLPDNISNPAPLSSIGWISVKGYIAICQIMFLWRTLCLPEGNEYRMLVLNSITKCITNLSNHRKNKFIGPVEYMFQAIIEYGFLGTIQNCIRMNKFGKPETWKGIVKKTVWEYENIRWKASCILYGSLRDYSNHIGTIKLHPWWLFTKDRPHMTKYVSSVMALLLGSQPRGLQRNFNHTVCKVCDEGICDSPEHILFVCPELSLPRKTLLKEVLEIMPNRMARDFKELSQKNSVDFILNAFNSNKYVKEWSDIMDKMSRFVYFMYKKRADILDPG